MSANEVVGGTDWIREQCLVKRANTVNDELAYYGPVEVEANTNTGEQAQSIGLLTVKVVHYPDCQQLVLWLPEDGHGGYGSYRVLNRSTHEILEKANIAEKLSGTIQLLFDTLSWPPAEYTLEIEHPQQGKHVLQLRKRKEGESALKAKEPPALDKPIGDSMWTVYRDGFGNPIPNEDQAIRGRAMNLLKEAFNAGSYSLPRVEYESSGRAGNVTYVDESTRITFWYEMGGGDCKVFIDIPSTEHWEAITKTPLTRRKQILEFLAKTVQREKAPSWRYEIQDQAIAFY